MHRCYRIFAMMTMLYLVEITSGRNFGEPHHLEERIGVLPVSTHGPCLLPACLVK